MKITPSQRKLAEISYLETAFGKLSFLAKMKNILSDENYREIYKRIGFKFYTKETIVFKKGDIGLNYFIILDG